MTAYRARLIERSDHYVAIKPVRSNGGWTATLVRVSPEMVETREKQTKGNRIKKETETTRDLKIVLSDYLGCPIGDFDGYNERKLLDLFHENFAGLYGNSSGKNIEIAKYEDAKEKARLGRTETKRTILRLE